MRVLIITNYCFKSKSANGYCIENIINALCQYDIKIDVVSFHSRTETYELNSKVHIYYVMNRIFKNHNLFTKIVQGIINRFVVKFIDQDSNALYKNKALRVLRELCKENQYDCIISSLGGRTAVRLGLDIKKQTGTKWVSIYMDPPVKFNHIYQIGKPYYSKCLKQDEEILKLCDKLFLEENIYNKMSSAYLSNKFIKIGIPLIIKRPIHNNKKKNGKVKIAYFGTLSMVMRNPKYAINFFREFNFIQLDFYGDKATKTLVNEYKSLNARYCGNINHEQIGKYIEEYDYLLNIGNANFVQIPSKLYDYMTYRKPIINIVKKGDPTIKVIKNYKYGISLIEEDKDNGSKLMEFMGSKISAPMYEELANTFHINTPEYSAKLIYKELMD